MPPQYKTLRENRHSTLDDDDFQLSPSFTICATPALPNNAHGNNTIHAPPPKIDLDALYEAIRSSLDIRLATTAPTTPTNINETPQTATEPPALPYQPIDPAFQPYTSPREQPTPANAIPAAKRLEMATPMPSAFTTATISTNDTNNPANDTDHRCSVDHSADHTHYPHHRLHRG